MWRWIFGMLFIGALGGGGYWLLKHPQLLAGAPDAVEPIKMANAELKDIEQSIVATGDVRPAESTDVKSEVSGMVIKVSVEAGDHVKKGDPLVTLDRKELESQRNESELGIKSTQMRLDRTKQEYDRNCKLMEKKLIPEKEYLDSKVDVDLAENDLLQQRAKLETLDEQLKKTKILAPHDGIVLNLDAQEGAVIVGASSVSSGTVLMQVANLSRLRVMTNINEVDVTKVRAGMVVELSFDSIVGLKVPGKVTFVSPSTSNAATGNQNNGGGNRRGGGGGGDSIRTFPATIQLDTADERIRPGITATIKVPIGKVKQAVALPAAAVFVNEDDQRYVYVKTSDVPETWEKKNITTGINDTKFVEVTSGVKKGDSVARERPKMPGDEEKKTKKINAE